ncbi:uncharacterized protein [Linepithema humile]|uniref:uncharacterized protein n=1 Tax=Linepithema humile TaxID=83485 RepID=UPI00351F6F9B
MYEIKDQTVSGSDTENRHVGDIVPVPHGSSSCQGLTSTSSASVGSQPTIASVEKLGSSITLISLKRQEMSPGGNTEAGPSGLLETIILASDDEENVPSSLCRTDYSDDEMIVSGGSSGSLKQKKGKGKITSISRKRKKKNSPTNEEELDEDRYAVRFTVDNRKKIDEEMAGLSLQHAAQINLKLREMTNQIDSIRIRSTGIKGSFSGQIKMMLEVIRRTGDLLSTKASSKEDPEYWKARFYESEKIASDNKAKADALEVELKEVKRRATIKDVYNFDLPDSELPVFMDGDDEVGDSLPAVPPSIADRLRSSSVKVSEVRLDKGKTPHLGNDIREEPHGRVELDLAIIRSLDRLGEGMTQLIQETRLLRDDLNSGGSKDAFLVPGPPSAREKISLTELNIRDTKIKRSITGGILIEIPGEESDLKADMLLSRLTYLFKDTKGVRIRKPTKNSQLKLLGLDDSISLPEICNILSDIGKCSKDSISCSPIRFLRGGLGVAYVRCPIAAAVGILEAARISIGWTTVRVEPVDPKPLQCFRCLAVGHTYQRCPETKDRSTCCYRCGEFDHRASECRNRIKCPVCADRGLKDDHPAGALACKPIPPGKILASKENVNKDTVSFHLNTLPELHTEERRPLNTAETSAAAAMDTEN